MSQQPSKAVPNLASAPELAGLRFQTVVEWGPIAGRLSVQASHELKLEETTNGVRISLKGGESIMVPYPNVKHVVYK